MINKYMNKNLQKKIKLVKLQKQGKTYKII